MATAQINARIDAGIKSSGDAALGEFGYTPTKAIRALWAYAGKYRGNSEKLREVFDVLEENASDSMDSAVQERVALAESGPTIYAQALEDLGVGEHASSTLAPYDELLEQAYADKMVERGLA